MGSNWQTVSLGEVLTKSEDWVELQPDRKYKQVTIKLWGQGVVLRNEVFGAEIRAKKQVAVRERQFILSRIDARNGAFGIVPQRLEGAVVSNDFPAFTPDPSRILPEFLGWMSKTASFVELCKAASEGTTNRVRLKENQFLAMKIFLPSLDEQRRIVGQVEALAARVEEARGLRSKTLQQTEILGKVISDKIYATNFAQVGSIRLEEACFSITDGDHQTPTFLNRGVRFIFVGNVSSGYLHFNGCKHVSPEYYALIKSHRKPCKGDILYSAAGATLGIPAMVDCEEEFCFQRHVALIKPDPDILVSRFLWYMLRSETLYQKAWEGTTGSAQPTIPLKAIRALPVPVPPLAEQHRIIAYLDTLQAKVDALQCLQAETAAELDALLPAILDRAFKGAL